MKPPLSDLTGRWIGHYEQGGQRRPIFADLVQDGGDLNGSMRDGEPDRDYSLFEVAVEAGLPPGADEQIHANLRAMNPEASEGSIRYTTHLPADSHLKGRCNDRVVYFVKTYMGKSFSGFKVGDKMLGRQKEGHAVHYEGRLSSDGLEIEGQWWIDPDPSQGSRRTEGLFTLRREAKPERPSHDPHGTLTSPARDRS